MILVSNNIYLSPTQLSDADALTKCLTEKGIYDNTAAIPYPYTRPDALTWLEDNDIFTDENGFNRNFAIRIEDGELIGTIGLQYNYGLEKTKSEFGYWLTRPYWGKGVMTAVIGKFAEIVKASYNMEILEAHVFVTNLASQSVLLKNGFTKYPEAIKQYKKEGKKLDAVKFAKQL
jgi:RimJ/RimL family protein N-acetyltransferase